PDVTIKKLLTNSYALFPPAPTKSLLHDNKSSFALWYSIINGRPVVTKVFEWPQWEAMVRKADPKCPEFILSPYKKMKPFLSLGDTSFSDNGQKKSNIDLSGLWYTGYNGEIVVNVSHDGANLDAVYVEPGKELRNVYGFKPGEPAFRGKISGKEFRGTILTHFPIEFKSRCPGQWIQWKDLKLSLTEDGNTLQGLWIRAWIEEDCTIFDRELTSIAYFRKK
ncbi:MAG: hypothetical protein ACRENG_29020, partial [bacterium]